MTSTTATTSTTVNPMTAFAEAFRGGDHRALIEARKGLRDAGMLNDGSWNDSWDRSYRYQQVAAALGAGTLTVFDTINHNGRTVIRFTAPVRVCDAHGLGTGYLSLSSDGTLQRAGFDNGRGTDLEWQVGDDGIDADIVGELFTQVHEYLTGQ